MGDHRLAGTEQLHGPAERNLFGALGLTDHQLGHIHGKVLGDVVREALDFDETRNQFEQAAFELDALGFALGVHTDADFQSLGEIDALKIDMQQAAMDGVHLAVDEHHGRGIRALDGEVEDGVETRLAVDDLADGAGIDGDADGIFKSSVNHRRNLSGDAHTARFILAARGANLGGYGDVSSHYILLAGPKSVRPVKG